MNCYKVNIESLVEKFSSNVDTGLSKVEVDKRLEKYGLNELEEKDKNSIWKKVTAQFKDFLVLILIGASIVSMLVGEITDSIVIIAIVLINASLGIIQEGRAEKSLEALKKNGFSQCKGYKRWS